MSKLEFSLFFFVFINVFFFVFFYTGFIHVWLSDRRFLEFCVCGFRKKKCLTDDLWLSNWSYSLFSSFHGDYSAEMHASNIRHWFNPHLYSVGEFLNAWFKCQCFVWIVLLFYFYFNHFAQRLCKTKQPLFFCTCRSHDHELFCASLSSSALLCWNSSSITFA